MRETEFEQFLLKDKSIVSKGNGIRSRINKAKMIERFFNNDIDALISDDDVMYSALLTIKNSMKDTNGNLSNALRKYYIFANGNSFPALSDYKKFGGGHE